VVIGLAASVGLGRLIAARLYGVAATDPLTLGVVAGVLMLSAVAACAVPAARAAGIDPGAALRGE
jgi:putative ABC transport system permease protein